MTVMPTMPAADEAMERRIRMMGKAPVAPKDTSTLEAALPQQTTPATNAEICEDDPSRSTTS